MKNTLKLFLIYLFPLISFAAVNTIADLVNVAISIIQSIIPILVSIALILFIWGIVKFILHAGSGNEREEAKDVMFWGLIALFVLFSIWGIIRVLQATLFS